MRASRLRQLFGVIILLAGAGCSFTVDSVEDAPDANPGDGRCADRRGRCTLRAAIMESNADAWGGYTVRVPPGTYRLSLPAASGGGPLRITQRVVLHGSGAFATVIDQDAFTPVIQIEGDIRVQLNHVTVQGGNSSTSGGGVWLGRGGRLELNDSVIRGNFAFTGGGGLFIAAGSTATVRRTSILDNQAQGAFGGGLWNRGHLSVFDSTIANNASNRAGGIRNEGTMNLHNVTVSGNRADSPFAGTGGISQIGSAVLNNVTLTNNTGVGNDPGSFWGGGIQTATAATTVVKNSIIAGNHGGTGPNDCDGSLSAESMHNLIGRSAGCTISGHHGTFRLNVPANLGPLANNGGPTWTHLPLAASPALDSAHASFPPAADACEGLDQRGVPRPQGAGGCDMGAVEVTAANVWVTGFVLVDAATNTDLRPLLHRDRLNLAELPAQLSIRAEVSGVPGSVVFSFDGNPSFQTENVAPHALGGDIPAGDYAPVPLSFGPHTVTATPFLGPNGTAAAGGSRTVTFHVVGDPPRRAEQRAFSPAATGKARRLD